MTDASFQAGFETALALFWRNVCLEQATILASTRGAVEREAAATRPWLRPSVRGFWDDKLAEYDTAIAKLRTWGGAP